MRSVVALATLLLLGRSASAGEPAPPAADPPVWSEPDAPPRPSIARVRARALARQQARWLLSASYTFGRPAGINDQIAHGFEVAAAHRLAGWLALGFSLQVEWGRQLFGPPPSGLWSVYHKRVGVFAGAELELRRRLLLGARLNVGILHIPSLYGDLDPRDPSIYLAGDALLGLRCLGGLWLDLRARALLDYVEVNGTVTAVLAPAFLGGLRWQMP
ncbi:MAG: hypothetical protein KC503_40085 [Myxococcales bacterium]|nr:hypothetical protein [Myxococcales bacterium]